MFSWVTIITHVYLPIPDKDPVVSSEGNKAIWIGFVNDTVWTHSGDTVSYTIPWASYQPLAGEDCTVIGSGNWLWYDKECDWEYGFICEKHR